MTVFNNNLDKLLGKNSYRDGGAKYEAENNMTCPSGCTLITEKNNYYSNKNRNARQPSKFIE